MMLRQSRGGYWDLQRRATPEVFYSNNPPAGMAMTIFGPVRIPSPSELEGKADTKEKPRIEDVIEAERRALRQAELDAMPGAAEVKAELDAEDARKAEKKKASNEMSRRLRAPAETGLTYSRRFKEQ